MSFEAPAVLWALLSVLLLLVFSLWRQAAARSVVPSVLLWKKIPERNPPLRALRRPRWRLDLLLQALAVAAAVAALAGPFTRTSRPKPRKVSIVLDTSARMLAGGRLEKAKEEVRRLREGKLSGDEVTIFSAAPEPRRLDVADLAEVRAVHEHVDVEPLLAAARHEAAHVVLVSDRPREGVRSLLLGGPGGNVGIVELTATDSEVFVRGVNHGAPRAVTVLLKQGEGLREERVEIPSGVWTWQRPIQGGQAERVSVDLVVPDDPFSLDDAAHALRLGPARTVVSLTGRPSPPLLRALGAIPGVVVRQDGGEGTVSVGFDDAPAAGRVRIRLHSPARPVHAPVEVVEHPLTAGLAGRGAEMGAAGVGELPVSYRQGRALFRSGGVLVGVAKDREIHLCLDMDPNEGWPAQVSFPIFWANAIDWAREGASAWAVFRTGVPVALPADARIVNPSGHESEPSRVFLGHEVGEYVLRFSDGERRVWASLLDARESDVAGTGKPLDWDPGDPSEREPRRRSLAGVLAGGALLLVLLAWLLQRRGN